MDVFCSLCYCDFCRAVAFADRFFQSFYNGMAIRSTHRAAEKIAGATGEPGFAAGLEELAADGSLLILVTDWQGEVLYSADEHSAVYRQNQPRHTEGGSGNPYRQGSGTMSWQEGTQNNLPPEYDKFLESLRLAPDGQVGYETEDGSAYIYGQDMGEMVLYMSTPLGGAGAAVGILRMQLLWVTCASLVLASLLAWLLARQFSRPVAAITGQAKGLPGGGDCAYEVGFCRELDELSETLADTARALQKLEGARKELLANISHDLRTPLTMIKGYAEMVKEFSWEDEGKREHDLSIIMREADRLTALVGDILEYSSAQAGGETHREPVDINSLLTDVAGQFDALCEQRGCRLDVEAPANLYVLADRKQMGRALYNLLDNGLRHTRDRLSVAAHRKGGSVRVEVRDNGPGIPPEELPMVWERYFTARQRREKKGTGLGLAIVKELLTAQKAGFGVESQLGAGTVFWFELPVSDSDASQAEKPPSPSGQRG